MKSFEFSVRVYVKATRITPFIMPRDKMYRCDWGDTGVCRFEGIENGYAELRSRLDEYFFLDQPTEDEVIQYYDRLAETLMEIKSQADFETAMMHSSQTYSPFSLVVKVNAVRREEYWYNGESMPFESTWRISKPKFACIRSWLMNLKREGQVRESVLDSCSYSERAFLFCQFNQEGSKAMTNQNRQTSNPHQSNLPNQKLTLKPDSEWKLLESESHVQKMLHEKMMMDPAISLVLFNEYIPLRQRPNEGNQTSGALVAEATEKMSGLFLGKVEEKESSSETRGLFIRSELPSAPQNSGEGLFIRSESGESSKAATESSSSPMCTTDDWVIA